MVGVKGVRDGGISVGVSALVMVGFNVADVLLSSFRGPSVGVSAWLVGTTAGLQAAAVNKNILPIKRATQGGSLIKGATLPA